MQKAAALRRYMNGSREADLAVAARIDKSRVHEAFIAATESGVDYMGLAVLAASAHVEDMLTASGSRRIVVVFPRDVADIVGISDSRAGTVMGDLKRAGLLEGSARAGYRLVPAQ